MKFLALVSLLPLLAFAQEPTPENTTGDLGDAAVIKGNPNNVTYTAVFDKEGKINGEFLFHGGAKGDGVHVVVSLKGFTAGKGPWSYHIHDQPVAADGNCTSTKAHLDPYIRRGTPPCNPAKPETCEVGDLSGKHGKIADNSTSFKAEYNDLYLSLQDPSGAFIGNRSVVIHAGDASRVACANITIKEHGHGGPVPTHTPTPVPDSDSGAAKLATGAFAGLFVALAAALAL